jgi:two-component system, NtrC family, response regulator PilR
MGDERVRVLAVDDDRGFLDDLARLMAERYVVEKAHTPREAFEAVERAAFDAVLLDLDLGRGTDGFDVLDRLREREPDLPVIMVTRDASAASAVTALKKGAVDYLDKRPDLEDLERRITRALAEQRLSGENRVLGRELDAVWGTMVGASPAMERLRAAMDQAAAGTSPVLIVGETGTGKELVARGIHRLGRGGGVLRAVNCAAIPRDLFESELFGSERGAFTGANRRIIGAFEEARDGVLFLDEVTEMDPGIQAKLLRVIEEREFRRLGGGQRIDFRGRLVASTNRDPERAIAEGALRQDLYYRLSTFVIHVPPLRERVGDIPLLVEHFLTRKSAELGAPRRGLDRAVVARLCAHAWPGNVRQLQSAIERHLTGAPMLDSEAGAAAGGDPPLWTDDLLHAPYKDAKATALRRFQKRYVGAVLAAHGGDVSAAAASMGLSAFGLQKMLRALEDGGLELDP